MRYDPATSRLDELDEFGHHESIRLEEIGLAVAIAAEEASEPGCELVAMGARLNCRVA